MTNVASTEQHSGDFDILIIGGGVVGAMLALALANQPLKIGIVEAQQLPVFSNLEKNNRDERAIALTNGSVRIFDALQLWEDIKHQATPIKHVHVSDAGHFGSVKFSALDSGFPAFGYVVSAHHLTDILQKHVLASANITTIYAAKLEQLVKDKTGYRIKIAMPDKTQTLSTRLLIAADGADSLTRKLLNLPVDAIDYQQSAIVVTIQLSRPHQGVAYERFTPIGSLAALPTANNRCVVVWTMNTKHVDQLMTLSDDEFRDKLQSAWGYRLGRILSIEKRQTFPLRSIFAPQQVCPGAMLIGNAAHTLHPVAAQGLNLSLKDVAVFADMVTEAVANHQDPIRYGLLEAYMENRKQQQRVVAGFTHSLIELFSNNIPPLVFARNSGLSSLNLLPFAKKIFVKTAMGLAGRLPGLMRR